jgi:hypothetical protein
MNKSRLLPPLLAAVIAGAGGYFLGRGTAEAPSADANKPVAVKMARPLPPPPPRAAANPAVLSAEVMDLLGKEPITAANAKGIAYRILEEPDPVTRMTACLVLLESMTAENARAIHLAFVDITKNSGRKHDGEWGMMLRRFGSLMGAEGFKTLLPDMYNVGLAVEGLAAMDPEAALEAIKASGLTDPALTNSWLNGLCVKDPQRALKLALNGQYNSANGQALLSQAISCIGVDKAKDFMQEAINGVPPELAGSVAGTDVFKGMYNQLGEALFHKNWTLGTPAEMLPWVVAQKDEKHLQPWFVTRAVRENFAVGDPVEVLNFLDTMNTGREAPLGTGELYQIGRNNPKMVADFSEADCARFMKYLPPDRPALQELAREVGKLNPARAAQLLTALPQLGENQ